MPISVRTSISTNLVVAASSPLAGSARDARAVAIDSIEAPSQVTSGLPPTQVLELRAPSQRLPARAGAAVTSAAADNVEARGRLKTLYRAGRNGREVKDPAERSHALVRLIGEIAPDKRAAVLEEMVHDESSGNGLIFSVKPWPEDELVLKSLVDEAYEKSPAPEALRAMELFGASDAQILAAIARLTEPERVALTSQTRLIGHLNELRATMDVQDAFADVIVHHAPTGAAAIEGLVATGRVTTPQLRAALAMPGAIEDLAKGRMDSYFWYKALEPDAMVAIRDAAATMPDPQQGLMVLRHLFSRAPRSFVAENASHEIVAGLFQRLPDKAAWFDSQFQAMAWFVDDATREMFRREIMTVLADDLVARDAALKHVTSSLNRH